MYVRGEYAAEQGDAGMLGYVQTGEPMAWAAQLGCTTEGEARGARRVRGW